MRYYAIFGKIISWLDYFWFRPKLWPEYIAGKNKPQWKWPYIVVKQSFAEQEKIEEIKMANNQSGYNAIICDLRDLMFSSALDRTFKMAGLATPTIDERLDNKEECAKAFFISLAVSAFGASSSYKADLILSEMALLTGFYGGLGMQERRVKYLVESNYHIKRNPGDVENKDLPYDVLSDRAKQFNKTDAPIFEEMIGFFLAKVKDKPLFFYEACDRYLEMPVGGHKFRMVRIPAPSYATKFEEPIKIVPLLSEPDFVGRDDYLSILERNFKEEDGRVVYVLHGMDGIGKTEIALQYVERHLGDYNTVIWLDATSIETLRADCQRVLVAYDTASFAHDYTDQTAMAFCRFIEQRNDALLVFDNADYLTNDPDDKQNASYWLRRFIPTGKVDVIITTHCDGNLPGARRLEVDILDTDAALELLDKKADREPDEYAAKLIKGLGYLPLGIIYAGAYIREMGISYKDYLDKWERLGVSLFDQNDSIATIRDVFHITLDKIYDVPYALPFLQFFSELGVNTVPLKEFMDAVARQHFLVIKDLDKHPVYEEIDDLAGSGKKLLYRIIDVKSDGTKVLEGPDGNRITKRTETDPVIDALSTENNRDRIIRALQKYSLASSYNGMVTVHPLLLEIVFDESHHQSREEWIKENPSAGILYDTYTRAGSNDRAREQLYQIICHGIEQIQKEIQTIPKMAEGARANGYRLFNMGSILFLADVTTAKAEK